MSIVLEVPGWRGHLPGQHVDVRLTAEDGYQAQRSYSIASAPEDDHLVLTVERLEDGEVSVVPRRGAASRGPARAARADRRLLRVGASLAGPVLLVAGGSGIVPFRSMLRHRAAVGSTAPVRLLYSARSLDDVIYREELMRFAADDGLDIRCALTRDWPQGWQGTRAHRPTS